MIEQLTKYSTSKLSLKMPSYRRFLHNKIDFSQKLIGIIGARGAGKTTLMLQYLKSLDIKSDEFLYISCDHPLVSSRTLLEIAEEFGKYGGKVLAIDEIHKKSNFCVELKNIYDFLDIKLIFTGSSALHLEQCQSDLSRRALVYRLPELSFREYLEIETGERFETLSLEELLASHLDLASGVLKKLKPLKYFSGYLEHGAYPIFTESKESYLQRLVEIVNEAIVSDIAEVYNIPIQNIVALKKLLEVICRSKPYEINYEQISASANISKNTLKQYLLYLKEASLSRSIGGMARGNTYIAKPDKIYLHNTNLFGVFCSKNEVGTIRETFFASQIDYGHTLHYPKKGDFEIDEKYLFEIGGEGKSFNQIKDTPDSFLVKDGIESGFKNSIPLWCFGFLY